MNQLTARGGVTGKKGSRGRVRGWFVKGPTKRKKKKSAEGNQKRPET